MKLFSPLLNPLFALSWVFFFNALFLCKNTNCKLGKEYSLSSGARLAIVDFVMFTTIQWCCKKSKEYFSMLSNCLALYCNSSACEISRMWPSTHGSGWRQQSRIYFKIHSSVWCCEHVTYTPPVEKWELSAASFTLEKEKRKNLPKIRGDLEKIVFLKNCPPSIIWNFKYKLEFC